MTHVLHRLTDLWARTNDRRFGEDASAELRTERLQHVAKNTAVLQPFAVLVLVVVMMDFLGRGVDTFLYAWFATAVIASVGFFWATSYANREYCDATNVIVARGIVMSVILCAPIWVLVPIVDGDHSVLLGAVAATILGVGPVTVYPIPRACVSGSAGCILAGATPYAIFGIWGGGSHVYLALASLMVVQGVVMCLVWLRVAALATDRFGDRLQSRARAIDLARQKELTDVLLQEYEDGSEAALWECDVNGTFTRNPKALTDALGPDFAAEGNMNTLCDHARYPDRTRRRMRKLLDRKRPFLEEIVRLNTPGGGSRWLSFRARPVLDDDGYVKGWRGMVTDVTDAKRTQREMRYLADNDIMTGLANRTTFNRVVDEWSSKGVRHVCIHLDLDRFKLVNDTLGHAAGDALLKMAGKRMKHEVRTRHDDSVIARIGGDEFMIGFPLGEDVDVGPTVDALITALSTPFDLDEGTMSVGASAGLAVWPDDGTAEQIPNWIDLALYRSKENGRGQWCRYEDGMDRRARDRKRVEVDLRSAAARNELRLVYQPVVEFATGLTRGVEALLRWDHPELGMVPPDEFIPIAENSGTIVEIGEWVLREACTEAASWSKPIRVAVNVSARQVNEEGFVDTVRDVLTATGLDPDRLEIELTETALMGDPDRSTRVLTGLAALGCRIVLDDFGTGYSSLSYIRMFKFDKIKVDRAFVSALDEPQKDGVPNADVIAQIVAVLARELDVETTAEGVETEGQSDRLRDMGYTYGQGWLFARPVPAADLYGVVGMRPNVEVPAATAAAG